MWNVECGYTRGRSEYKRIDLSEGERLRSNIFVPPRGGGKVLQLSSVRTACNPGWRQLHGTRGRTRAVPMATSTPYQTDPVSHRTLRHRVIVDQRHLGMFTRHETDTHSPRGDPSLERRPVSPEMSFSAMVQLVRFRDPVRSSKSRYVRSGSWLSLSRFPLSDLFQASGWMRFPSCIRGGSR